jgi:hypothetical protein
MRAIRIEIFKLLGKAPCDVGGCDMPALTSVRKLYMDAADRLHSRVERYCAKPAHHRRIDRGKDGGTKIIDKRA